MSSGGWSGFGCAPDRGSAAHRRGGDLFGARVAIRRSPRPEHPARHRESAVGLRPRAWRTTPPRPRHQHGHRPRQSLCRHPTTLLAWHRNSTRASGRSLTAAVPADLLPLPSSSSSSCAWWPGRAAPGATAGHNANSPASATRSPLHGMGDPARRRHRPHPQRSGPTCLRLLTAEAHGSPPPTSSIWTPSHSSACPPRSSSDGHKTPPLRSQGAAQSSPSKLIAAARATNARLPDIACCHGLDDPVTRLQGDRAQA